MRKWLRRAGLVIGGMMLIIGIAVAATDFAVVSTWCPGGSGTCTVNGSVMMWLNGSNQAQPVSAANPLPTSGTATISGTVDENLAKVGGHTVAEGAGATGNGSQRVTAAQDPTTVAGSAPGTAGTPSAQVMSVQGVSGGVSISTGTYNRSDASPAVQIASYSSGNDIGGLVAYTLPATASGILQSLSIQFVGGATTAITCYLFDANPTGSTFTDKGTFTIAAVDTPKMINKTGIVLTPAVSIGGTRSAAGFDNYAKPFNSTGTIWEACAAGGTFTPASTTDMNLSITYYQNAK